ncbi:hypothetical protein SAMN04490206_2074 [Pseudomonas umsongensis]|nr:hypothetical protein SAMN04490206_2074 [Pseudomonas umsongensis]
MTFNACRFHESWNQSVVQQLQDVRLQEVTNPELGMRQLVMSHSFTRSHD